jgi:hypothetical protein
MHLHTFTYVYIPKNRASAEPATSGGTATESQQGLTKNQKKKAKKKAKAKASKEGGDEEVREVCALC